MTLILSSTLTDVIAGIGPCKTRYTAEAQQHLDCLTKPIGSLGRLEVIAAQMFTIFSGSLPLQPRRSVYVFAADHGVTEEGVSAYPRAATARMIHNFLEAGAAINVLARLHDAELTVVDVGVDAEFENAPGLYRAKVCRGSRNMIREPALTYEELAAGMEIGIRLAQGAKDKERNWSPLEKWELATRPPPAPLRPC
jgi:nicotinate-nucleotide--dimethylbenzimidazole phosphoribosyltransferase